MKLICVLLAVQLFFGCASTRIYEGGVLVASIQSDCTNVTFQTGHGTFFHCDVLNNSSATAAWGAATSQVIGAIAAGVVSGLAVNGIQSGATNVTKLIAIRPPAH